MPRLRGSAGSSGAPGNGSGSGGGAGALQRLSLVMSYLASYEHMGRARLSCTSGCSCDSSVIDAHHADRSSTVELHEMVVSPARRCVVRLAVLNETSSPDGEHKFKLIQIVARSSSLPVA